MFDGGHVVGAGLGRSKAVDIAGKFRGTAALYFKQQKIKIK